MKILLLIVGIVSIAACFLSLLYSALNHYGYKHVLDGSNELYDRLHRKAIIFFVSGTVLAVIGTACIIFRSKL